MKNLRYMLKRARYEPGSSRTEVLRVTATIVISSIRKLGGLIPYLLYAFTVSVVTGQGNVIQSSLNTSQKVTLIGDT
jgi:hypothetical protein